MLKTFEDIYYDARCQKKKIKEMEKKRTEKKETTKQKNNYFKNSEMYARGPDGYKMVLFYSRSKDKDARYLSSMQPCELHIDGKTYMSMEHYFQSQKYPTSKRYLFEKNSTIKEPKKAKSAGSKSGMKKNGEVLDLDHWNGMSKDHPNEFHRIRVMKKAIWARFKQDKRFRNILCVPKTFFVHYEKKRGKYDPKKIPSWGAYKSKIGGWTGLNILGLLYLEIARFHNVDGWLEKNGCLSWSVNTWKEGNKPLKAWQKSHPLIPHKTLLTKKEWNYGGFYLK